MLAHAALKRVLLALALASGVPTTTAHSWVEQLQRIAKNGTMLSAVGYQRAFVGRGDPGFKGDVSDDLWQLPPSGRSTILSTDSMCSPQQKIGNYSAKYPQLITAPGDYIAMRYQENGHVTIPTTQENKPSNRGTIYVYGTENPMANDTLMAIHNVWNVNGTGGDGRGRLIATRNYDDGQCYQVNGGDISASRQKQFSKTAENPQGADLWCQSDIQLPTDISVGANYTIYWVWDWPTLSTADAMIGDDGVNVTKPEIYTSCVDLEIVEACSEELGDVKSPACGNSTKTKTNMANTFSKGQSYNAAAVPQELSGNFAVQVDGASVDSGSNNGMSAPTNKGTESASSGADSSTAASSVAPASTLQTITTPASSSQGQTVTETIAETTVYVTQGVTTVTVTVSDSSTSAAALLSENSDGAVVIQPTGVALTVEPFMNRRRTRTILS